MAKNRADAVALSCARLWSRRCLVAAGAASVLGLTAYSAILAKEANHVPALLDVREAPLQNVERTASDAATSVKTRPDVSAVITPASFAQTPEPAVVAEPEIVEETPAAAPAEEWPADTRWFDGRPIRPIRTITMEVTGYSPDQASCGDSADGITATLHSVDTNGHALVAADPRVLPYGSMVSVPGYDGGLVVPVLDCGGAIKGKRLDLLFPTHQQARAWGRKFVKVTVWGFADGGATPNPRKVR